MLTARLAIRVVGATLFAGLAMSAAGNRTPDSTSSTNLDGRAPTLFFEANHGQWGEPIQFVARSGGMVAQLSAPAVTFFLSAAHLDPSVDNAQVADSIVLRFIGGNSTPSVAALEPLPGRVHYLTENDPTRWRSNIPTYGRISYRGIYPGIDVLFYGANQWLEYDLVVSPGARVDDIRIEFDGAKRIEINDEGELLVHTSTGTLLQRKPAIYQQRDGERRSIDGQYFLDSEGRLAFDVPSYDPSIPLVIDPVLDYGTYFGGEGHDEGLAIAVDEKGHAYVAGTTGSRNLMTIDEAQLQHGGERADAFVMKLTPDGDAIEYLTYLGGSRWDGARGVAIDNVGNAYLTGVTASDNDFPLSNAFQPRFGGGLTDAFLVKLSPNGGTILYSTYFGGWFEDAGNAVAVNDGGEAHIAGSTASLFGFPRSNPIQRHYGGGLKDAFIAKFNASGDALHYSTYLGGERLDKATGVALDGQGNAIVSGTTSSRVRFPIANALQPLYGGGLTDAFVAKITPAGDAYVYSTYFGGSKGDGALDVATDKVGKAYITGHTTSDTDFPIVAALQGRYGGGLGDAFIARLAADGLSMDYSTYIGGSRLDTGTAIAVSVGGSVLVAGFTRSDEDFPSADPAQSGFGGGAVDAFAVRVVPDGSALGYATFLGGDGIDQGWAIAADTNGGAYIAGLTTSRADFPLSDMALQPFHNGAVTDAFIARLSDGNHAPAITSTPVLTAAENLPYSYLATASDSDGDPLTYGLVESPAGMNIDPVGGLVTWIPDAAGIFDVEVSVADERGGLATQSFAITAAANSGPVITSAPITSGVVGAQYQYDVDASDADGDTLTVILTGAPPGMTIDSTTGLVTWTPDGEGDVAVSVEVSDGRGGIDLQSYAVTVAPQPNRAPELTASTLGGPQASATIDNGQTILRQTAGGGSDTGSLSVGIPAPTAASLAKFGDIPVSLYTGAPNINVPLYELKGRKLSVPISLSYHASGVKVGEIPGWVGLGWALNAGGVITRTVRGLPDDTPNGYSETSDDLERVWETIPYSYIQDVQSGKSDPEPDQFFFNFAGRSGKFVMGDDIRTIPYSKLKFEPSARSLDGVSRWTVTDENGTKYIFADIEWSYVTSSTCTICVYPGSWYLSKIESADGKDEITFDYEASVARVTYPQQTYRELMRFQNGNCSGSSSYVQPNYSRSRPIWLKSITSAQGTVEFAISGREDFGPEKKLDQMTVKSVAGNTAKSFAFTYAYSGNTNRKRLRLDQVAEQSSTGVSLPPYAFTYDDSVALPERLSNAIDHWGFHNGQNNDTTLPAMIYNNPWNGKLEFYDGADREPREQFLYAGTLTNIQYPTGGTTRFDYEPHDYSKIGIREVTRAPGGKYTKSATRFHQGPGVTLTEFTIDGVETVPVLVKSMLMLPPGQGNNVCSGGPCAEIQIRTSSGSVLYRNNQERHEKTILLAPSVTYFLAAVTNGSPEQCLDCVADGSVTWREVVSATQRIAGGLRISQITDFDGLDDSRDTIRFFEYLDGAQSSGVLGNEPRYHFAKNFGACQYLSRSSMPVVGPGMTQGSHVGYRRVVVKYGGSEAPGGWTEHVFQAADIPPTDIPMEDDDDVWPFAAKTSYDYYRGFEKQVRTYNSAEKLLEKKVNERLDAEFELTIDERVNKHYKALSVKASIASKGGSTDTYFRRYEVISSWLRPESETITVYDQNGLNPISTTREFEFANRDHLQLTGTTETNSDGTVRKTVTEYANEQLSGMKLKNMLTQVYSTIIKKGTDDVESKEWTTFALDGGYWRPDASWAWVGDGSTNDTTAPAAPGDSETILVTDYVTYDDYGRVKEQQDARGTPTTLTYGGANEAFLTRASRGSLDTAYAYHPTYNQVTQIDENGFKTNYEYDNYGRLKHIRNHNDELLSVFIYTYGLPSSVQTVHYLESEKTTTSIQYVDGLGRPIQNNVENGAQDVITATEYDAYGRVKKRFKPYFAASTSYDKDYATNAKIAYTNDRPYVEVNYLAEPLNRVDRTLPEGESMVGVDQNYFNDASAGLTYVDTIDESSNKTRTYTDKFGNRVRTVAGLSTKKRIATVYAPEPPTTQYAYDVLGNLTLVTDPNGYVTSYENDPLGRLLRKTSVDAGTAQYKYDKNGNLRFSQDAQQAAIDRISFTVYDENDRVDWSGEATANFSTLDPDIPQSFEFSSANWLRLNYYHSKPASALFPWSLFQSDIDAASMSNLEGRLSGTIQKSGGRWQLTLYSYNPDGFVTTKYVYSESLDSTKTTFTYGPNRQGSPLTVYTQVGAQSFYHFYDYGERGQLEKVFTNTVEVKPATPDVHFSDFTPSGLKAEVQFLGGTTIPSTYTIRDWVETIDDLGSPSNSFAAKYTYNGNGTVSSAEFKQLSSPSATKGYIYTFGYDALNRMTSADSDLVGSFDVEGVIYDTNGNIKTLTRRNESGAIIDQLTYGYQENTNRLDSVSDAIAASGESWDAENASFGYDANGNMTSAGAPYDVSNIVYDPRHLPEQMTKSGAVINYLYSAEGQRYYKKVGSQTAEQYVMDGDVVVAVFDENGNLKHWNIVSDRVLGRRAPWGTKYFYIQDNLGSTRSVVTSSGQVVETNDYYPFGLLMPGRSKVPSTPAREKFTGKERDVETGFDYFGARYYMPALGRWMAVDPVADLFPDMTPYNYTLNDPINLVDPDGKCAVCLIVLGILVADALDPNPTNAPGPQDQRTGNVFRGKSDIQFALERGFSAWGGVVAKFFVGKKLPSAPGPVKKGAEKAIQLGGNKGFSALFGSSDGESSETQGAQQGTALEPVPAAADATSQVLKFQPRDENGLILVTEEPILYRTR